MRNKAIDILRGLGILLIIFIHITSWYSGNQVAYSIWNWGQFAVPAFVFCSTYLFFVKKEKYEKEGFIGYSRLRLKRLLVPYYIWLAFFYLIYLVKDAPSVKLVDVFRNATLTTTGNEVGWAVLLFVYMSLLMFPLIWMWRRARTLFYIYSLLALGSAFTFIFWTWPFNFKLVMWLPWSLLILFSWFFAKYEEVKGFFLLTLVSTGSLLLSLWFLSDTLGSSLAFYANKYPPNLYYLTYGIFSSTLLYYLAKKGIFDSVYKPINFLSINSYSIFFIHLFLIFAFSAFVDIQKVPWWIFVFMILALSILIQLGLSKLKTLSKS